MSATQSVELIARPPRWTWHAVVLATVCMIGFLLVLPAMESLARIAGPDETFRQLRPEIIAPPPTSLPPPPMTKLANPRKPDVVPELVEPSMRIPINVLLDLDVNLALPASDFAIQVDVLAPTLSSGGIFELADLDHPPQATVRMNPVYPARARIRKVEGFVRLRFVIDADGQTGEIDVVESQPAGVFDDAAVRSIKRWKFKPGKRGGESVATRVTQRLEFKMPR